jgi:hypothetical protein
VATGAGQRARPPAACPPVTASRCRIPGPGPVPRLDDAAGAGGASSCIWRRMKDYLTDALLGSGYVDVRRALRAKHELRAAHETLTPPPPIEESGPSLLKAPRPHGRHRGRH